MSTTRRGAIAALALALALALAGCTAKTDPPDDPTTTHPTTTVAPSPTPTPIARPERPDAMNTADEAGAIATAEYFMELYTYARQTGDLTEWNALSADDCSFCNSVTAMITKAVGVGNRVNGSLIVVHDSTSTEVIKGQKFSAKLRLTEGMSTETDSLGNVVATGSSTDSDLLFALEWNGAWVVRAVDVTPTPTATP